jgi:NADH:ubiquinone oxidoreductase subunit 6 (subunit J)
MIVYFGAIIIFFAFALMTIDPRHFEYKDFNKKYKEENNFFSKIIKTLSFFIITFIYFYIHYNPIKNINFSKNFDEYFINNKFSTSSIFVIYETTAAQALGRVIYTTYVYPLNTLGIILFIALVCSLAVLKSNNKNNNA